MSKDKKTYHNMDTPYYTDEKVRAKIDGYLIEVAALESNIGIDVKGGAKREIKSQQHEILMKIRPLDSDFLEVLVGYDYQKRTPDLSEWLGKTISLG